MAAAAASVAIDVIGVVSGALGIFQFAQDQMPSHKDNPADSSYLRVHLGGGIRTVPNAGGSLAAIKVYNEEQTLIGAGSGDGPIPMGSFQDITIDQSYGPGQQPTYVQISGTDDAVCIAYLIQTWPDGTQRGWLGDMGQACGATWGYSNVIIGTDHKPACTWLDQDHTGILSGSMQIHMQDFTNLTTNYSTDPAHYCAWPAMYFEARTEDTGLPDNQIWGTPVPSATATAATTTQTTSPAKRALAHKRGLRKRSAKLASTIVGSHDEAHSAIKLCSSETSHGSDFVSFAEGVFCDMETKTAWPLCKKSVKGECYDWERHALVEKGGKATKKVYHDVQNWE